MQYATLQDHLGHARRPAIEQAAALGLDGVELVIPGGVHDVGPHGMDLDSEGIDVEADDIWSPAAREDLRGHAAEHGVTIPSLCPSYLNFRPGLTAEDAGERGAVVSELERLVAAAADIDARVVLG
ncbi:MAG: TIM barrel protein, partial [Halobacteriaceae archaeon]